ESGIIKSAHDCSEGGLAVALAESCITNSKKMLGATVELGAAKGASVRMDEILFGEAPSRIVISLSRDNLDKLEKIAKKHAVELRVLGNTGGTKLTVRDGEKAVLDLPLGELSDTWRNAIPRRLQ
ncbi:unnamed protein product, partial [marine sediment metagenome]